MDEQKVTKEETNEQEISKQKAKSEVVEQEVAKEVATEVATEAKVTLPIAKDPKRVEAGKLSAISRAAKKRQQKLLLEQGEPHPTYDYKPFLYFGIPSVFLAGMYLWTMKKKE